MDRLRPSPAVREPGKRHQSPAHGGVVERIRAPDPESPVDVDVHRQEVLASGIPLEPNRRTSDQRHARPRRAGPGYHGPQTHPDHGPCALGTEVLTADNGNRKVPGRPGSQREFDASVAVDELQRQTDEADPSDRNAEPDAVVVLGLDRMRHHGQREGPGQPGGWGSHGREYRRHPLGGQGDLEAPARLTGPRASRFLATVGPPRGPAIHVHLPCTLMVRCRTIVITVGSALGLAMAGCEPPDRPPRLPDPLPPAFIEQLAPDSLRTVRVAEGVWYRYVWTPVGPWAIHLVEVDLLRCQLGLAVTRAPEQQGKIGGHARVSDMALGHDGVGALVAVNGDFFTPEGTPLGPEVTPDALRSLRSRPVMGWRPGNPPWIGRAEIEADTVLAVGPWRMAGRSDDGAVIGGYPELLDAGLPVGDLLVSENPGFAASRHPRTAVGVGPAGDVLWILVVDGRQGDYSLGMTLPELAALFQSLGVTEALNLDGGGSSVMVVRGRMLSHPSDEEGEREVVNALLVREDPAFCDGDRQLPPAVR